MNARPLTPREVYAVGYAAEAWTDQNIILGAREKRYFETQRNAATVKEQAHLFAAAHEMKDTLRGIVERLESLDGQGTPDDLQDIIKARTVIEKTNTVADHTKLFDGF